MSLEKRLKEALRRALTEDDKADEMEAILEEGQAGAAAASAATDRLDAAANVDEIADPGTATAEDVALKVNELIQALQAE